MSESTVESGGAREWATAVAMVPVGVALVVTALVGNGLSFASDEWNMLADYHFGNLLEPFNGHLTALPAGMYQALFNLFGVDSYWPYRFAGLTALGVLGFQVARFAVHRLDGARLGAVPVGAVIGFLATGAVLWNSAGQMNLMFPFLVNFTVPLAALGAIWWHLDRRSLRGDVAASVWLAAALATSGLGLTTALTVGVELLVGRAPLRRWLVLSPGPVLWLAWFVTHRNANEQLTTDVVAVIEYAARMVFAAFTSIAAGSAVGGAILAALFVAYVIAAGRTWRSLDARFMGALAGPLAFAVLTAITRIGVVPEIPPDELRYKWAVAAYLVLAAVAAGRPRPLLPVPVPDWVWWACSGVAFAVLLVGGARLVDDLREWNHRVSASRPGWNTLLFAAEAVGPDRANPNRVIPINYVDVTIGGYLRGVASVGSPISGVEVDEVGGDEHARRAADLLLVEELPIRARPAEGSEQHSCDGSRSPTPSSTGGIVVPPGSEVLIEAPDGLPVEVGVSRFSSAGLGPTLTLPVATSVVTIPDDHPTVDGTAWPYRLSVPAGVSATLCS